MIPALSIDTRIYSIKPCIFRRPRIPASAPEKQDESVARLERTRRLCCVDGGCNGENEGWTVNVGGRRRPPGAAAAAADGSMVVTMVG